MTRALTRTPFHSSQLVRTLADLALVDASVPDAAFAEKLGQWIDIAGAIALRATHTPGPADGTGASTDAAYLPAQAHMTQVRQNLERAIEAGGKPATGKGRNAMPVPKADVPIEIAGAYEPYRRYYVAHQRDMELKLPPLRAKVREALAGASQAMQQLAAMDAALDRILAGQESRLLAKVPNLLEQRFKHLRSAHQQTLAAAQLDDNITLWTKPGGWLARFCHELQTVLLAELDVRLQPVTGLLEALHNEQVTPHA